MIVAAAELPQLSQHRARWFPRTPRRSQAIWIVLHCTAGNEGPNKAEDVAKMLASIPPRTAGGKPRSAHLVIDSNSVVQCVPFEREAWHGGASANRYGEGIEFCGRADQSEAQWLDEISLPMLQLGARIVRWRCEVLGIPFELRTGEDLIARRPGITTHAEIAKAFPRETNHHDPGPSFPMQMFLNAVRGVG